MLTPFSGRGVPPSSLQAWRSCVSCAWTLPSGRPSRKSCVTWPASLRAGGRPARLPRARPGESEGGRPCRGAAVWAPRGEGAPPWLQLPADRWLPPPQVGDPGLGAVPGDLRRRAGATGCSLCKDGPGPPRLPAPLQVLARAPASAPGGLQPGALSRQVSLPQEAGGPRPASLQSGVVMSQALASSPTGEGHTGAEKTGAGGLECLRHLRLVARFSSLALYWASTPRCCAVTGGPRR